MGKCKENKNHEGTMILAPRRHLGGRFRMVCRECWWFIEYVEEGEVGEV